MAVTYELHSNGMTTPLTNNDSLGLITGLPILMKLSEPA